MTTRTHEFDKRLHDAQDLANFIGDLKGFCIGRGIRLDEVHVQITSGPAAPATRATLYSEKLTDDSTVYNLEFI